MATTLTIAEVDVEEIKKCRICKEDKVRGKDFYACKGTIRTECKKCTVALNAIRQKGKKPWLTRYVDNDETRLYMTEYYRKNKAKYAEYRRKFNEKYPTYHRDYMRNRYKKK